MLFLYYTYDICNVHTMEDDPKSRIENITGMQSKYIDSALKRTKYTIGESFEHDLIYVGY